MEQGMAALRDEIFKMQEAAATVDLRSSRCGAGAGQVEQHADAATGLWETLWGWNSAGEALEGRAGRS